MRLAAAAREHGPILALVSVSGLLRAFRLGDVAGQLIGDESYYVQDARVLLGLSVTPDHLPLGALSGLDPNPEHPPLAKVLMAASMKLLGLAEGSWRAPSVVLGTLSIWLLYRIVLALGGSRGQALFAAFVLAFDNLSFIHGRIAMLEMYLAAFTLVGTWLYLGGRYELAGVAFGAAMLCKLNGSLGLLAVFLYDALCSRDRWRNPAWPALRRRATAGVFCLAFFLPALGALDGFFTHFRNPFEHLAFMTHYHVGLTHPGLSGGDGSNPLAWWANAGAMEYLSWPAPADGSSGEVLFRAAMNQYVIAAAPFAFAYAAQQAWSAGSRLGAFAIASLVANYGTVLVAWALLSRTTYIYYMVASLPAVACALAVLAWALPRTVRWGYAALVLYCFCVWFPFRYF